jgi:mRNA interferase MazF
MTECNVGDVVSVEFPFSDLQGRKRRPGLVLAVDSNDALLARLTTHPARNAIDVALRGWSETGLPKASTVRLTKLAAVDRRLIHHWIGRLTSDRGHAVGDAW